MTHGDWREAGQSWRVGLLELWDGTVVKAVGSAKAAMPIQPVKSRGAWEQEPWG